MQPAKDKTKPFRQYRIHTGVLTLCATPAFVDNFAIDNNHYNCPLHIVTEQSVCGDSFHRHASVGDWANLGALLGVVLALAFLALGRVDRVDVARYADRRVWAFEFAGAARRAQGGDDHESHGLLLAFSP